MKSNFCKIPASKSAHDDKMTRMAGWRCEMRRLGRVDFPVFVSAPDGAACLRRLSRRSCSAAETDGLREFWMLDFECMEFGRWVLRNLVPPAGEVERRSRDPREARVEARLAAPTARKIGNWRGAYLSGHGTSVPMNLTLLFGTEVPCFENNKLGVHEQNNREPFDYSCTALIN